ncbi:AraC family transcriptional regulator [Undibacterium sp. TJN25]|uniref:AraC family transcriptional regulator n=1 Tax=Undibacterium sp. TJN25 TaxID=3413056 RepID=UPI003BF34217
MTQLINVTDKPKGVVDPAAAKKMFRLERYLPGAELAHVLDHYWIVEWNLEGRPPYTQKTLPYPCVNLVFDKGRTAAFGVVSGAFDYTLQGSGRVLGLRFRPGAFRCLLGRPMHTITDRTVRVQDILGCDDIAAENLVLSAPDDTGMVAAAEDLLLPAVRQALPEPDTKVEKINRILNMLAEDIGITRVEDLAEQAQTGMRALQQLFSDYVGVSPKWVIRRYRLQEAADRLAGGDALDLAELAHGLGYFDQAHLTRDFRKLVGKAPAEYRKAAMPHSD